MNRNPGGTPTGGQFAAGTHAEAEGVSITGRDSASLPEWGTELDARVHEAIGGMGEGEAKMTDLLGTSHEDLVARYGQERGDWVNSLHAACTTTAAPENPPDGGGRPGWDEPHGTLEWWSDKSERSLGEASGHPGIEDLTEQLGSVSGSYAERQQ